MKYLDLTYGLLPRAKFVFDSEVIDASYMEDDFFDSMDYFYKSLKGTSKEPVTMQIFLIDDATFSGMQIAKTIRNLNSYLEQRNPEAKIDLHISVACASHQAETLIDREVTAINERYGGDDSGDKGSSEDRFKVLWEWEGEPVRIPFATPPEPFSLEYPGALAFEHKIPDRASWGGPFTEKGGNLYENALRAEMDPNFTFPPYKKFTPKLHR